MTIIRGQKTTILLTIGIWLCATAEEDEEEEEEVCHTKSEQETTTKKNLRNEAAFVSLFCMESLRERHLLPSPMDSTWPRTTFSRILLRVRISHLAYFTLALPLFGLAFCFFTAMLFHYTLVNTTACKVYNFWPSVSAVTGVSPQRYVWRICIALHVGPRLLLASLYPAFFAQRLPRVCPARRPCYLRLTRACYALHITEALALVGATYISNRENYPVHEKIFAVYLMSFLIYMVTTCAALNMSRRDETMLEEKSRRWKMSLLFISLVAVGDMMYFFYKHRTRCVELAFSCFSICEYIICCCNMAFHFTFVFDIPDDQLLIGHLATKIIDDADKTL
ncbi:post-GPI attachment to proteins factor 2-like [Ornithodoros turicata]|uniref:post-GPI attachment to proteins factor 2-like n=1 Tax=Ornithodoros turicata TaxID=34597 RepID=UPI003139B352